MGNNSNKSYHFRINSEKCKWFTGPSKISLDGLIFEEDKNKVPMNKPYNIQNTNICNGIFHISFFKALLINEGERE
jgi:hypothetical protein